MLAIMSVSRGSALRLVGLLIELEAIGARDSCSSSINISAADLLCQTDLIIQPLAGLRGSACLSCADVVTVHAAVGAALCSSMLIPVLAHSSSHPGHCELSSLC
jgi:hypothetical protein